MIKKSLKKCRPSDVAAYVFDNIDSYTRMATREREAFIKKKFPIKPRMILEHFTTDKDFRSIERDHYNDHENYLHHLSEFKA